MLKKCFSIIGIIAAASFISGCSGTTQFQRESRLDRNWGRSYETAIYNQMLNPDADKNLEPVLGLEGAAAEYTIYKYKDSFKEAETKEMVNILKLQ